MLPNPNPNLDTDSANPPATATPTSTRTPITLNLDVIYTITHELVLSLPNKRERNPALCNLSLVSRALNEAVRPVLFESVRWPHVNKHGPDDEGKEKLYFFPQRLWRYFKTFHLDWPDHWPDTSPPTFGTTLYGLYVPSHLPLLERALPHLTSLHTFQMTCPFYPPISLFRALVTSCPGLKDLRIIDTPFNSGMTAKSLPREWRGLERVTLVPVVEAIRVGEGPFEKKYHDLSYWTREYRKKHWNDMHTHSLGAGGFFARSLMHLFCAARPENLRYIQISGSYFTLFDFAQCDWPCLETWILTGPEPIYGGAFLVDAVRRMPGLRDLRVLFSKAMGLHGHGHGAGTGGEGAQAQEKFGFLRARELAEDQDENEVFRQLKSLAISNWCNMTDVFQYATNLEKLAFVALINHPRIPIAMSRREVDDLLEDLEENEGGRGLRHLRIIMEDGMDWGLFVELGRICPRLEVVEVEVCGYREGDAGFEWTDYGDAFSMYQCLQRLRVGIPFEGCDTEDQVDPDSSLDPDAFLRADRRDLGTYIASRVPTLIQIGFEYRMKTGSHRYEDRWMDFEVERVIGEGGGVRGIRLRELSPTWYPFPEVWEPVALVE